MTDLLAFFVALMFFAAIGVAALACVVVGGLVSRLRRGGRR